MLARLKRALKEVPAAVPLMGVTVRLSPSQQAI